MATDRTPDSGTSEHPRDRGPSAGPTAEAQASFWNSWNTCRQEVQGEESHRQRQEVCRWLEELGRDDLKILEVGCGTGWLLPSLTPFGEVTATDIADESVELARQRHPEVSFLTGDIATIDLDPGAFDVVVALEVLSHVEDQQAFVDLVSTFLRPGGRLMIATQNRPVLQRYNEIPPPSPGQLRRWVDAAELRELVEPACRVLELFSVAPVANRGLMRVVNSRKVNAPVRAVLGDRVDRLKERWGLGATLMCLAERIDKSGER